METNASKTPLVLLDFDEVLNMPLANPIKPGSNYKWRRNSGWDFDSWSSEIFHDEDKDTDFVITTSTDMISALLTLEESGLCTLAWLTTWTQHDGSMGTMLTADDVNKLSGTSVFWSRFADRYNFLTTLIGRELPNAGGEGIQHPFYSGAMLMDDWWKWDAVKKLRAEGHPLAFADDVLKKFPKIYKDEERDDDLMKLLRVDFHRGFTRSDFSEVKGFLKSL